MKRRLSSVLLLCAGVLLVVIACQQQYGNVASELRKQIKLGEKVFNEKECGKCHSTTGDFSGPDTLQGHDLASVFLAMDTLFVKSHLQFTELTSMPPIPLTPHEISAVTQYIGVLHAKANMDPNLKNPDGVCPVCGAPLMKAEAEANHLVTTYAGKQYYFECPDCKIVFQRDPAWHSQSGYLQMKMGVKTFIE